MQTENLEGQESIFGRDSGSGKMSSALSQVGGTLKRVRRSLGRIFKKSSKRSSKLKNHTFMLLDLRPGVQHFTIQIKMSDLYREIMVRKSIVYPLFNLFPPRDRKSVV